ncbi:MAG TPA: tripartite tricarboxylate transporter substrate binding protein [Burkholderiales bacterium]|jgi:tripartite-type tricarboxylate transporter receptor subunit TctC|nr:tripartite tricarboxylate transporter substrate binding protein [Burkholderiales bacterium]
MIRNLVAAVALAAANAAHAQPSYPSGPINLVIPLAAGDATDTAARAITEELSRELKVAIVPVNRPGAAGALGTDLVVKAPKDGHTILLTNNAALVFRTVLDPKTASYDPFRDLTPLALAMRSPSILVANAEQPYHDFKEMIDYGKKAPISIGTAGVGSVGHFCINTIASLTKADLTMVPYTGATPALTAVRGNHVGAVILALGTMTGHLKSGALRGIVISSKVSEFPDIPTLAELGYSEPLFGIWTAFFAPAGVPPEVTNVLVPALERAITAPGVAARLKPLGIVPEYAPPAKLVAEMHDEHRRVSELARQAGLVK